MTVDSRATITASDTTRSDDVQRLYQEGLIAGLIGAAVVALWFLIVDTINGRPLYTPTVLGSALFRRGAALAEPEKLAVSLEMVAMFTWVHALLFATLGGVASRLLAVAERNPNVGFGILMAFVGGFVVFQVGFTFAAMLFAPGVVRALGWANVLVANLLAAAAMAVYFRFRHPTLAVKP